MKELIARLESGDESAACYTLIVRSSGQAVMQYDGEGTSRKAPLDGEALDRVLEAVSRLAADFPDTEPVSPPYRSAAVLKDGSRIHLPYPGLLRITEDAWFDAQFELDSMMGPRLMGLVPCQTPPTDGFMGMMQPQGTAVRVDSKTWNCACGKCGLHSKFCPECGTPSPVNG